MSSRGGEFSTGTMGNFQSELTGVRPFAFLNSCGGSTKALPDFRRWSEFSSEHVV